MIYLRLFYEFLKAGLFTVGGGLAALPFLSDIADNTGWFTQQQLADMVAVSESTPGPIGINMATYVGFTTSGIPGAIIATLGFIIPSIVIVTIVSKFLDKFNENKLVKGAFYGLRPASVGLISAAWVSILKLSVLNLPAFEVSHAIGDLFKLPSILLAGVAFFVLKKWNPHPVFILAGCAVVGIVFRFHGV